MGTSLRVLSPLYKELHNKARAALADMGDLPQRVREFVPDEHELAVLEALEWLLDGDDKKFCSYELESDSWADVAPIEKESFRLYQRRTLGRSHILRWALLLHDIAKDRGLSGPHPENCARVGARVLSRTDDLSEDEKACVLWLIKYHDVFGNIYSGERSPSFLLDITQEAEGPEIERRLELLQAVMLCDLRGIADGRYLTDQKARFWLGLSKRSQIRQRQRSVLSWRIERWTGNLAGGSDPVGKQALVDGLYPATDPSGRCLVESAFGERISYIVYGFYLFTALDPDQLATLMRLVSYAVDCLERRDVTLIFETVYRPPSANASPEARQAMSKALHHYTNQLDEKKLRLGVDLSLKASGGEARPGKGGNLYCP